MILEPPLEHVEKEITDEFLIIIRIDYLEVTYKMCEDFGNSFKPFLEIHMDDYPLIKIPENKSDSNKLNSSSISSGGTRDDSLNMSVNLDLNASVTNTVSSALSSRNSKFSSNTNNKEKEGKLYNFRSVILI